MPMVSLVPGAFQASTRRCPSIAGATGLIAFAAAVAMMLRHYRQPLDLFMMTIAMVAAMALGTAVAFRVLAELLRLGFLSLLVMAAVVVWEITLLMRWYRRMRDAA